MSGFRAYFIRDRAVVFWCHGIHLVPLRFAGLPFTKSSTGTLRDQKSSAALSFCRGRRPYLLGVYCAVGLDFFGTFLGARRRPELFSNCLESHIERRDGEDADQRGEYHAAEDWRADIAPRELRGADSHYQWQQTEDEGQRRHHDGPEAQAGAFRCRLGNWNAPLPFLLRELDDEDAVLRRKPDEDDHADLTVEIERQPSNDDCGK